MFLPLTVTLVSAPGLAVFLVARSSFFTWATAGIKPLNKRAINRIRFISDVVPFCREYTTRAATAPAGFTSETSLLNSPGLFLDFSWVTGNSDVTRLGKGGRPSIQDSHRSDEMHGSGTIPSRRALRTASQGRPTRRRRSLKRSSERYRSKIGSSSTEPRFCSIAWE